MDPAVEPLTLTPESPTGSAPIGSEDLGRAREFVGKEPRTEIVYITQIVLIYLVVVVSLINLSLPGEGMKELWTALLSSSIGYMLPNPSMKSKLGVKK